MNQGGLIGSVLLIILSMWVFPSEGEASIPARIAGLDLRSGKIEQRDISETAKAHVVVFLSAKCPCSASHERVLKQLAEEFQPKGFQFVGIHSNGDEDLTTAGDHFAAGGFPFPIIEDLDSTLANELGALKTPHVFVISGAKVVYSGGVDDSQLSDHAKKHFLKEALNAVNEGRMPPIERARALGCVIKRK